jgi:hypothetical protein
VLYKKADKKIDEIEKEYLAEVEVIKYINGYCFLSKVMSAIEAKPLLLQNLGIAFVTNLTQF